MSEFEPGSWQVPKRSLREFNFRRDAWFPFYFFFWKRLAFVRRIWCKHEGVHYSDSSKGPQTMCANCDSTDVPQCCNSRG